VNARARVTRLPALAAVLAIRLYQRVISPWTPPSCRYYPSCSQYALVAIQRHGLLRGGWLAVRRLARCHPWAKGGVDHVPPVAEGTAEPAARPAAEPTAEPAAPVPMTPPVSTPLTGA
jgi:putative membrane protein insertion efficiency factor